jgi:aminotransferase
MRSAIAASGHQFRTKNVSRRAQSIVISPIKEMSILADEYAAKSKKWIISFGQGIPFFDTPDYIKNGMRKSLNKISTSKYTLEPGMTELRQLIAKDLKQRKQILDIKPKKEIMVSAGCQEAVACALAATIDPGDEVLLFSPGFASHIEQTIQWNGVPKFIPLTSTNGWRIDLKTLEKKSPKKLK